MYKNPKTYATAAVLLVVAGIVARELVNARYQGEEERAEIRRQAKLDIAAINQAAEVLNKRIERGEITNITQLADAVRNEIDFQKIAIRES